MSINGQVNKMWKNDVRVQSTCIVRWMWFHHFSKKKVLQISQTKINDNQHRSHTSYIAQIIIHPVQQSKSESQTFSSEAFDNFNHSLDKQFSLQNVPIDKRFTDFTGLKL